MNIQLNKVEPRPEQKQQRSGVNHSCNTEFHLQRSEVRYDDAAHQVDLALHSLSARAQRANEAHVCLHSPPLSNQLIIRFQRRSGSPDAS